MLQIVKTEKGHVITENGREYALIPAVEGALDSFEQIEAGAWH